MGTPHKATPEQWEAVESWADGVSSDSCILELRSRIEALEANQPHQQDKLDRLIALDRSDPASAPAGGLVERVAQAVAVAEEETWRGEARAAILVFADWMQERAYVIANGSQWAERLRDEV